MTRVPSLSVPLQCFSALAQEPVCPLKGTWFNALTLHYLLILKLSFQTTVLFSFFPRHCQKLPSIFCAPTSPLLVALDTKNSLANRSVTVALGTCLEGRFGPLSPSQQLQLPRAFPKVQLLHQLGSLSSCKTSCSLSVLLSGSVTLRFSVVSRVLASFSASQQEDITETHPLTHLSPPGSHVTFGNVFVPHSLIPQVFFEHQPSAKRCLTKVSRHSTVNKINKNPCPLELTFQWETQTIYK